MKQKFVLALACIALIIGCKTDNADPDTPTPGAKYLERAVTTEDGHSVTYHLTYDDKNRLVTYYSTEDDYRSKVTYDGNSNPIKFELESDDTKQVFDITYNSSGVPITGLAKLINAETPNEAFQTEIRYEAANGRVDKMYFTDETGNEATYTLSYAGNNLTKVVYAGADGELVLTWKYGNKKSPFSAARFKYLVIPDLFSVFSCENEIMESTLELTGVGSITTRQEYQYDAAGYPISATEKDAEGNVTTNTQFHYK